MQFNKIYYEFSMLCALAIQLQFLTTTRNELVKDFTVIYCYHRFPLMRLIHINYFNRPVKYGWLLL